VAHEALIRHWGRLRQWLTENRNALRQKRSIETDAQEWLDKDQAQDYLLQGLKLAEAEAFFQRNFEGVSLSLLGQEFVNKSIWRRKNNLRRRIGIVASVIVSLSGLTIFSFIQTTEAQRQNKEAQRQSITAKIQASEAFFSSGKQLDALVEAVQAGKNLKDANLEQNATLNQAVTVKLQQLVYGVQERNRLLGHDGDITSVAFSPDGKVIASASRDGTIKLWNLEGHEIKTHPISHHDWINEVSFSPDGKILASAGADGKIKLWSLEGEKLQTFSRGNYQVKSISFSSDGKLLVSANKISLNGTITETITLWNLEGQIIKTFIIPQNEEYIDDINSVRFSPDSKIIVSGSVDGIIRFWNLEGQELQNSPMSHGKRVTEVNFSPDGKTIASAGDDGIIKLWSLEGEELKTLTGHSDDVYSVNFSPDGKRIASASADGTIKIWSRGGEELKTISGHSGYVLSVNFSPDSKMLVSGGGDKKVGLWDIEAQKPQIFIGHAWDVYSVSFSPDGQTIASASEDETIKLWNLQGQVLKTFSGHTEGINDISFSPDGKLLASAGQDKTVRVWNLEGEEIMTITGHSDTIYSITFSPDGKMIASGSSDQTIKIWNLEGRELTSFLGSRARFSPDGKTIASSSVLDYNLSLWNLEGEKLNSLSGHSDYILSHSFSPDGKMIASAGKDNTIKLWNLETQEVKTLSDHTTVIYDVSFSPDGKLIASVGSADGLRLWSREGQPLLHIDYKAYNFHDVDFSPDGKRLVLGLYNAVTQEGTVMLFDLALEELLGRGCHWLHDYLKNPNNGMSQDDARRDICDDVKLSPQLLIEQGSELIEKGDIQGATTFYKKAQKLDPTLKITVDSWNALCWNGSLQGYANDVMFACENAVSMASEDAAFYRDSRGLARALTGDTKGAIEDFEAFIKWVDNEGYYSGYGTKRQSWIDALRAGENPFTPEEKERLLNE
jgi:WD40 repeat protein